MQVRLKTTMKEECWVAKNVLTGKYIYIDQWSHEDGNECDWKDVDDISSVTVFSDKNNINEFLKEYNIDNYIPTRVVFTVEEIQ